MPGRQISGIASTLNQRSPRTAGKRLHDDLASVPHLQRQSSADLAVRRDGEQNGVSSWKKRCSLNSLPGTNLHKRVGLTAVGRHTNDAVRQIAVNDPVR